MLSEVTMGYPLSDPPTEDEVEGIGARVDRRLWLHYEDEAIQIELRGPSGERVLRLEARPDPGIRWSQAPFVDALTEFGEAIGRWVDLMGASESPQRIVLELDQYADMISARYPGVRITRAEILSLDVSDWLD